MTITAILMALFIIIIIGPFVLMIVAGLWHMIRNGDGGDRLMALWAIAVFILAIAIFIASTLEGINHIRL